MRRFTLFLKHALLDSHNYVWSNSNEGKLRGKSCRHLKTLSRYGPQNERG